MSEYKIVDGIAFHPTTPDGVCQLLAHAANTHRNYRVRIFYGDAETGRDWLEEYDTIGYIGRSTGSIKPPLMIANVRSICGPAILDNCIVKITIDKSTVYSHFNYHQPAIVADGCDVFTDGKLHAQCHSCQQADKLAAFLRGERNSK
jgi:hypothetical protein